MSELNENIQNFGKIKSVYNNILVEGFIAKNDSNKQKFKKYVSAIKESDILKHQFLVYTNIENKVEADVAKATQFLNENINLFSRYTKKDIFEANAKLIGDILFEGDVDDLSELHENISKLIFTTRTAKNIDSIIESTSYVVNYIVNNKPKVVVEAIELPSTLLSTVMVESYNKRYADLDESEKAILKVLIDATDEEKKEVYSNTLKECISLINEKLGTSDLDAKDKLLRVKEKLLNDKQDITEEFEKNISKLAELRGSLKDN